MTLKQANRRGRKCARKMVEYNGDADRCALARQSLMCLCLTLATSLPGMSAMEWFEQFTKGVA